MSAYRLAEHGVEYLEPGRSTFIAENPGHGPWRDFQSWCALGNQPLPSRQRPGIAYAERKKLWIIGAGGFGREVYGMSQTALGRGTQWVVAGFLNDLPDALADYPDLPPIVADTDYEPAANDLFVCAVGTNVTGRKALCAKFKARGARFANLIHQGALVSETAVFGEGIILEAFTGIGANCVVGDFTSILSHVSIGHDVKIGASVLVASFANILGRVEVGDGCVIGSHAVILPGMKIGAGATVGAGSVVISHVSEGATVFGVPAKQIK